MTRRNGEIILFWRICQFDRYRNISLSLKNVMFVKFVELLNWYSVEFSVETNRTVEIVEYVEYAF